MKARIARLRAFADACDEAAAKEAREVVGGSDEAVVAIASALFAAYPALRGLVARRPDALASIAREGWTTPRKRSELLRRLLAACKGEGGELDRVRHGLRRASAVERLRIAVRELDPEIEVDATAREWSELAEVQLEVALMEARVHVERRFGDIVNGDGDRNGLCVLGLGKLGGSELNAGSDVDLVFVHEADEGQVGDDAMRPFDAFTRIAQRTVATIEEHEDEGFCQRVDLRLRPEGASGPLTNSIAASVFYYETFGRGWERAALVRARPIAGDVEVGARALAELVPFVWRRAVDPAIALEMAEMLRRGRVELSEAPARDLKLGVGGIREAEFFVQTLQLVWGGKDPGVRATNTLEALARLRSRGYVTDREARHVRDGYLFLRRVEHRVQLSTGVQTHLLPANEDGRDRLARSLGYKNGDALLHALDRARERIAERFASLTPGTVVAAAEERIATVFRAIDTEEPADELTSAFRGLARRPGGPLGGVTREKHPRFARALVAAILDAADPELAATTVRSFFDRLSAPGVTSYVRALEADERALSRFASLCGTSAYLGRMLVGHPELADALLFSARSAGADASRGARILAEEIARLSHADRDDPELFVGAMRRAKAALEIDVGLRDLGGEIEPREAARALTAMADATLDAATQWALEEIARRKKLARVPRGFALLALGSLGARDLGYGSDLDVVFVYDPAAGAELGLDDIDSAELYGRVAQRVVRLIGTTHPDGPGYDLDTRLRPSGEQGHLVVTLEGFRSYHLGHDQERGTRRAADWERQSLVRLRACAGDLALGAQVVEIAQVAAYERGAPDREELLRIRARMEEEVAKERDGRFDPKLGLGGIVDVDFAVQWLQMAHGHDPSVRATETLVAIDALEARGLLRPNLATTFRDGHRFLRRLEQRSRVVHGSHGAKLQEGAPGLLPIARSMGYRDGPGGTASELLMKAYRETTQEVRAAFLEVLRPG